MGHPCNTGGGPAEGADCRQVLLEPALFSLTSVRLISYDGGIVSVRSACLIGEATRWGKNAPRAHQLLVERHLRGDVRFFSVKETCYRIF